MRTHPRAESHILLEYQSNEPCVFGVEVRPAVESGLEGLLAGLLWLGTSKAFSRELTFVVMTLPNFSGPDEISRIAECADAQGLVNKLCLVAPPNTDRLSMTISNLQRLGLRAFLGGVGAASRLCDIAEQPIDGIMIEPQLILNATGDPRAASILDALVGLATNLGIKSFANGCDTQSEFDFATSTGISYVTYARPYIGQKSSFGAAAIRHVESPKQWIAGR